MRVLYITHQDTPGNGAEISMINLILDMRERYKISPVVLMPSENELADKFKSQNIEVIISKFEFWEDAYKIRSLRELEMCFNYYPRQVRAYLRLLRIIELFNTKNLEFDIIHTNASGINIGDGLAQKLSLPHIWHFRDYGIDDYNIDYKDPLSLVKEAYSRSSANIAISKSIYDSYVNERKLCSPDNTRIIYNGVKIPDSYEKKFLHDNRVNFCIIGGISTTKNQLMAVNACVKLKDSADKFILNIIGSCEGEYFNELQEIISSNGLENCVKFLGFHNDINKILRNMNVGLMLSRREAFGRVTVEYMLNYMPVIGVNTGATPEIINNESGFICELDDSEKLAELMQKFITNPELLHQMGSKARERAVKNFSLEHNTDEIYKLYQEILTRE
ncbi:MAG: glycosyltransferase family 4 protein [Synergistaceae bacterium]|nr:glycosyltransferase family 4 protein [Synergistaceae bacterium]